MCFICFILIDSMIFRMQKLEGELSKKQKLKSISRNFYYLVHMKTVFLITSIILHLLKS